MIASLIVSIAAIAAAGVFLYQSQSLPDEAAHLPTILAILVALLALAMLIQDWIQRSRHNYNLIPEHAGRVVGFVAGTVAYIALLQPLGYFIATPVFVLGMLLFLRTKIGIALAMAAGTSILVWALFVWFLSLPMPMGVLS